MIPFKRNFSESDWAKTPKSVQKEYLRLEQCVFELTKGNEQLEKVVHKERTKANKNSSNSDKPPSSDSPYVKRTKSVAYFKIQQHRSKEAFLDLVEDWKGILISDGYRLYQSWLNLRQTCLAHLIRAAKALTEHPKPDIRQFGENALEKLQTLCAMAKEPPSLKEWNEFYSGFIDLIFDNCTKYYGNEAGKLARRLLREIDSLWVFLEVAGVEPTNNLTERSLRFGVLWRKRSQGTRSNKGNRWVERLLSLRQTARIRNLSSFDVLVDAMSCYFKKQNPALSWIYE